MNGDPSLRPARNEFAYEQQINFYGELHEHLIIIKGVLWEYKTRVKRKSAQLEVILVV